MVSRRDSANVGKRFRDPRRLFWKWITIAIGGAGGVADNSILNSKVTLGNPNSMSSDSQQSSAKGTSSGDPASMSSTTSSRRNRIGLSDVRSEDQSSPLESSSRERFPFDLYDDFSAFIEGADNGDSGYNPKDHLRASIKRFQEYTKATLRNLNVGENTEDTEGTMSNAEPNNLMSADNVGDMEIPGSGFTEKGSVQKAGYQHMLRNIKYLFDNQWNALRKAENDFRSYMEMAKGERQEIMQQYLGTREKGNQKVGEQKSGQETSGEQKAGTQKSGEQQPSEHSTTSTSLEASNLEAHSEIRTVDSKKASAAVEDGRDSVAKNDAPPPVEKIRAETPLHSAYENVLSAAQESAPVLSKNVAPAMPQGALVVPEKVASESVMQETAHMQQAPDTVARPMTKDNVAGEQEKILPGKPTASSVPTPVTQDANGEPPAVTQTTNAVPIPATRDANAVLSSSGVEAPRSVVPPLGQSSHAHTPIVPEHSVVTT